MKKEHSCWPAVLLLSPRQGLFASSPRQRRKPSLIRLGLALVADCRGRLGDLHHISCLGSFLPLDDFELYLIAFLKAFVSFTADRAVMYKNIRTIFASDEPKSFCIVEPLDGSPETRHLLFLRASCYRRRCRRSQPAQTPRSSGFGRALLNCWSVLLLT